jgi:anion-transporting  ArsA/GET3 family ATPase
VIRGWEELSNRDIAFLQNEVEFNLVTIAEALAVRQLDGIFGEFQDYGLAVDNIIVNQVVDQPDSEFLRRKADMQQGYLSEIAASYDGNRRMLPLFPYEIKGLDRLEEVAGVLFRDG